MGIGVSRIAGIAGIVLGGLAWAALAAPSARAVDWSAHADEDVVEVVTTDEDGEERVTKVWLAVLDGEGYIRTGSTRWGANVVRDPDLVLRIAGTGHPLRAEFVEDEALRERVQATFREKYGWSDRLISPFRGRHPKIMRLVPRGTGE